VVVDDRSKDRTADVVTQIRDPRVVLVRNERNLGVGGATKEGFRKGVELGGDIFVKYDGDGQMDPERMEDLLEPIFDGYDYSKGNRFLHGNELKRMPVLRLIGSYMLTFLTKLASGFWSIFDPQNGYVAVTRQMLMSLPLERIHNRYFFENDMLVQVNIQNGKVKDVSMPSKYGDEKSHLSVWRVAVTFPWLLLKRFLYRVYTKYVLYEFSVIGLFYFCGGALCLFGCTFGAAEWILNVSRGVITTTGTVMIAVLPIILGFQLFLQAIVLEVQAEENRK
jgi:glycosyltransferase involved in cell wall biosynthesis